MVVVGGGVVVVAVAVAAVVSGPYKEWICQRNFVDDHC